MSWNDFSDGSYYRPVQNNHNKYKFVFQSYMKLIILFERIRNAEQVCYGFPVPVDPAHAVHRTVISYGD